MKDRRLTKPIPQIWQQQKCSAILARLQEDSYMQAQVCVDSGICAAVHFLSKVFQLLVRDTAQNHHKPGSLQ